MYSRIHLIGIRLIDMIKISHLISHCWDWQVAYLSHKNGLSDKKSSKIPINRIPIK